MLGLAVVPHSNLGRLASEVVVQARSEPSAQMTIRSSSICCVNGSPQLQSMTYRIVRLCDVKSGVCNIRVLLRTRDSESLRFLLNLQHGVLTRAQ